MTTLRGGGATDVGKVRQNNQDAFLVDDNLFVVCDGVGGHQGGEVASATAVAAIKEQFNHPTLVGLIESILYANRCVWEKAQTDASLRGMGTTVTAVALVEEDGEQRLAVVNVGDSRAYLLQQGELSQLTEDHSLVEQMFREGRLTREEADVHPQRSLITRALGLDPKVEVDNWQILPNTGDRLLLCSDGLTNEVPDDKIASILRRLADPDEAAGELVRLAREGGGRDNITVVVVDVTDDDDVSEAASAASADDPSTISSSGHAEAGPIADEAADETGVVASPVASDARAARSTELRPRRFTWRVALFMVVLLGVLGSAGYAVGWYARRSYYVGVAGDHVGIYRGRPGGLLWFDPTLEQRTDLRFADVPEDRRDDVAAGHAAENLVAARRYVDNLRDEAAQRTFATTPGPAPAPSTTAAPAAPAAPAP